MEPCDLKLQQVTFRADQIQDDSLEAFNEVIHYDSALLDSATGKKPNTQQVSNSSQFAWSPTCKNPPRFRDLFLATPFSGRHTSQNASVVGNEVISLATDTPLATTALATTVAAVTTTTTSIVSSQVRKPSLECEISRMIKDLYSEVEVPFKPLTEHKVIPDWILLDNSDRSYRGVSQPYLAQPSKVKVTHVYNQAVCCDATATPLQVTEFLTHPHNHGTTKTVVTDCDIRTLLQVSANTTAARNHPTVRPVPFSKMAERGNESSDSDATRPFESVAEALHLQQSVIGTRTIAPAPPEIVAQIIAEAERKLKAGYTPALPIHTTAAELLASASSTIIQTDNSHPQLPSYTTQSSLPLTNAESLLSQQVTLFDLPPRVPAVRSPAKSTAFNQFSTAQPSLQGLAGHPALTDVSPLAYTPDFLPQIPADSSLTRSIPEDAQSIASTNSELESLSENATEAFLRSLPPVKTVKLSDILPAFSQRQELNHSPPVKETSFRPLVQTDHKPITGLSPKPSPAIQQPFVAETGILSTDNHVSTKPHIGVKPLSKSPYVIPKPGPLFPRSSEGLVKMRQENLLKSPVSPSGGYTADSNAQIDEIRREKAKLEGQLEMLSIEAQATLQERAELQAQVASLKLKLIGHKGQHKNDAEASLLKADLESLKKLRISLENSVSDLQRQMEEKCEEVRTLQEEVNQSQDVSDKLTMRMKEIRDDVKTKEVTIQALKNKVAELYVDVQTSLQAKVEAENESRSAKSDLLSLQNTKYWYQQQLEIATKARSELQKELTVLQAKAVSQTSIIDRLKNENGKLRQQFSEIQNKALKEKELLAKHLETIESDMMDREAAFQEIQRERSFLEDTFNTKIQTAEDERNRITLLMQITNDLENQLDKAHGDLKKKQNQIVQLENENIELMKKLSLSQEVVIEKDNVIEEIKQSMLDLEARLKAFQNSVVNKDSEILKLKEDKAMAEIALKSALQEKNSVDNVLDSLKADMGKVETSFRLMRHELTSKSAEMSQIRSKSSTADECIEKLKTELNNERRTYELAKQDFENKSEQINELQEQKMKLEGEVLVLREKLSVLEGSHDTAINDKQQLDAELTATQEKLEEARLKLHDVTERETLQKSGAGVIESEQYNAVVKECDDLKEKLVQVEKDSKKDLMKHKAKSTKLGKDLKDVKDELLERQKKFDESVEILSGRLREMAAEKEKLETELTMVHRKYELSMLEQKDQVGAELQTLASELQQVQLEKQAVEAQLVEVEHARGLDLQQFQQQLVSMETELQQAQEALHDNKVAMETNQELRLELEKEKGRLAGLQQSNATLKQHVSQLEEALAGRESMLVDSQTQLQDLARDHELASHDSIRRIQALEEGLQKEKEGQRESRKQIGLKITENKKLRRQNDGLKQDAELIKQELESRTQELLVLRGELESQRERLASQQGEMSAVEGQNKSLQREVERVQQQLRDSQGREPVLQEQLKSLEWQLQLKCTELATAQEQMKVAEGRQLADINTINHLVQEKTQEIEHLKADLALYKEEKHRQQAKLAELRSALKSSIQYHKMTQKLVHLQKVGGAGDAGQLELPPLPFDLDDMDKLLQDTTFRALESKPLDNLQNCLLNLRSEISGLQAQMDVNTTTIETSVNNWSTIEEQVAELRHVVQTISNTTMSTATTNSLAAAAVDMAEKTRVFDI